jgi:hypothetical protein
VGDLVERDGGFFRPDDPSRPFAVAAPGNLLADDWRLPDGETGGRVVCWSGSLAADDDLFAPHPGNWTGPGRDALDARVAALAGPLRDRDLTLCLRPHARHVLSDAPSCRAFLEAHADAPVALALDPAALLEESMLDAAGDHLGRILAALAPASAMIILTGDHAGLPADDLHRLVRAAAGPAVPIARPCPTTADRLQ